MTKVRLSGDARSYLLAEAVYLRERNPAAAQAFLDRMRKARMNLARFPAMGRGIEQLPVPGSHRLVVGDYLIDYDVSDDQLVIVSIRHGQQQPPPPEPDEDYDYEER